MTELRVTVPDEIAARLASEAAERGTSAEEVAAEVLTWLGANDGPLVVPVPVVTETCYFIERDGGPEIEADFLVRCR